MTHFISSSLPQMQAFGSEKSLCEREKIISIADFFTEALRFSGTLLKMLSSESFAEIMKRCAGEISKPASRLIFFTFCAEVVSDRVFISSALSSSVPLSFIEPAGLITKK